MGAINFKKIESTDTLNEAFAKINEFFVGISTLENVAEGKKGDPGLAGLPGPKGPKGDKGDIGERGTIWSYGNSLSDTPSSPKVGDFFLVVLTGNYYRYNGTSWILAGSLNFEEYGLGILQKNPKTSSYEDVQSENVTLIINKKTNQTFVLSNLDKPDSSLGVQIPDKDSPGDTYPLIMGDENNLSELFDYKFMVFNSGDSNETLQRLKGKNVIFANSYAMKLKPSWLKASGFGVSVDLNPTDDSNSETGTEYLVISGISDGNSGHLHVLKLEDCDFYNGTFRIKNGKLSLGYSEGYENQQILDVNGGLKLGTTTVNSEGSIRYNAGRFQGFKSNAWVNLDLTPDEIASLMSANVSAFRDKVIDTSNVGGVIFGDSSAFGSTKEGMVRYNKTLKDIEFYNGTAWIGTANKILLGSGNVFTNPNGNPLSSKISVDTNSDNSTNPIYSGFILNSPDKSIDVTQDVIGSDVAVINLSYNGSVEAVDEDGEKVKVSSIDIKSKDIDVKKSISNNKVTYDLSFDSKNSNFFDTINNVIDFRSPDGSLKIIPPNSKQGIEHWSFSVTSSSLSLDPTSISSILGSGAGSSLPKDYIESIIKTAVAKYKKSTGTFNIAYNSDYGGHYSFLPLEVKDFDDNCKVISTSPFEFGVKDKSNGYYHIDVKARFRISNSPGGTFSNVSLVLVKNGTIISTLAKLTTNDVGTTSFATSKEIELSGSDVVDMTCVVGDCDDSVKVALVANFGTTSGTGVVTMIDSYASVFRATSITESKVTDKISNSNVAFKFTKVYDKANNIVADISSSSEDAILRIKEGTYINFTYSNSNILVESNIIALTNYFANNLPLNNSNNSKFVALKVGADIVTSSKSNANVKFIGGTDVTLSLSNVGDPTLEISVDKSKLNIYHANGVPIVQSFNGNIIAGNNLNFSYDSGNSNIIINVDDSNLQGSLLNLVYSAEYSPSMSLGSAENPTNGVYLLKNLCLDTNKFGLLSNTTVSSLTMSSGLADIGDVGIANSFIFKPSSDGLYEVSCSVEYDMVYYFVNSTINDASYPNIYYDSLSSGMVNLSLMRIGTGTYTAYDNAFNGSASIVSTINSNKSWFKITKDFGTDKDRFKKGTRHILNGTSLVPLVSGQKYGLGLNYGVTTNYIKNLIWESALYILGGVEKSRIYFAGAGAGNDVKLIVYNMRVSIKKI